VKEKGWHCRGRAAARVIYRRAISGGRPAIRLTPQASRKRLKPHRVRGRRCSDWVEAWSLSSRNGPGDDLQAPRTPDCHQPSTAISTTTSATISTTTTGPNVKCRVRSLYSSFAVVALIRCCRSQSTRQRQRDTMLPLGTSRQHTHKRLVDATSLV
jgi:hypothetical protein